MPSLAGSVTGLPNCRRPAAACKSCSGVCYTLQRCSKLFTRGHSAPRRSGVGCARPPSPCTTSLLEPAARSAHAPWLVGLQTRRARMPDCACVSMCHAYWIRILKGALGDHCQRHFKKPPPAPARAPLAPPLMTPPRGGWRAARRRRGAPSLRRCRAQRRARRRRRPRATSLLGVGRAAGVGVGRGRKISILGARWRAASRVAAPGPRRTCHPRALPPPPRAAARARLRAPAARPAAARSLARAARRSARRGRRGGAAAGAGSAAAAGEGRNLVVIGAAGRLVSV